MAYVLGFFCADGNLTIGKRNNHYIEFTNCDKDILEKIRKTLGSNHKISKHKRKNKQRTCIGFFIRDLHYEKTKREKHSNYINIQICFFSSPRWKYKMKYSNYKMGNPITNRQGIYNIILTNKFVSLNKFCKYMNGVKVLRTIERWNIFG